MFVNNIKIKDVKIEIGKLIKSLRKREGLTQEELSAQLELSRITIQNLESGKNFTIDTLLKMLKHFELLDSLYKVVTDKRNENENLRSLY